MRTSLLILALATAVSAQETVQGTVQLHEVQRTTVLTAEGYLPLNLTQGTQVQVLYRDGQTAAIKVRGVVGALVGSVDSSALKPLAKQDSPWGDPMGSLLPQRSHPGGSNTDAVTVGDVFESEFVLQQALSASTPLTLKPGGKTLFSLPEGELVQYVAAPYGVGVAHNLFYVYARGAIGFMVLPAGDAHRVNPRTVLRRVGLSRSAAIPAAVPDSPPSSGLAGAFEQDLVYAIEGAAPAGTGLLTIRKDRRQGSLQLNTEGGEPIYAQVYSGATEEKGDVMRARWAHGHSTVIWVRLKFEGKTVQGRWQLSKEGADSLRGTFTGTLQP